MRIQIRKDDMHMKTRLLFYVMALLALLTLSACANKENPSAAPMATATPVPTSTVSPTPMPAPTTTPVEVAAEVEWSSPLIKYMMECAYMGSSYKVYSSASYPKIHEAFQNAWNSEGEEGYTEYLKLFYETVGEEKLRITESFLNNILAINMYQPPSEEFCLISFRYYNNHHGTKHGFNEFPLWFTVDTLEDFRYMPNLEELTLYYTSFLDLTPLESLSSLNTFCIGSMWYGNDNVGKSIFTDLTPLTRCPNLKLLKLDCTNIDDLSALSRLSNLTRLELSGFNGQDLEFLSGMSGLWELVLDWSENVDLDALVKYAPPSLKTLRIKRCGIEDITALGKLTQLVELELGGNLICDISPLCTLTNLIVLLLTNNQISDISPLAGLSNLEQLDLNINQLEDISALAGLEKLIMLDLRENNITDYSVLFNLESLEQPYVEGNPEYKEFILEWRRLKNQINN